MIIKAICKVHPGSPVYLLEGTIKLWDEEGHPAIEANERAVSIDLDEANLYCTEEWSDHDLVFEVLK